MKQLNKGWTFHKIEKVCEQYGEAALIGANMHIKIGGRKGFETVINAMCGCAFTDTEMK